MKSRLLLTCLILAAALVAPAFAAHTAVTPAHRHSWWTTRNDAVNERVAQGNVDLLMIGDSITHGFDGGGKKY